jgi:3-deoxy-D-manno-octulosonic-acid transferase
MKFDAEIKTDDGVVLDMRSLLELRASDSLVVAGSTHSGEELALVGAYKKLAGDFPALKLLIAPRHIERTGEVARIVLDAGFPPVLISDLRSRGLPVPNGRVFILDEIGCLNAAYALASVVFIGGSLVRHGGQNPIEPAALARPILFGPYMFNFKNIQAAFLANNAALQVSGGSEICDVIGRLLRDAKRRNDLGANAEKVVRENRGATNRNMDSISWLIG